MRRNAQLKYRFNQLAGTKKHQLFIYDDITAYGKFNWNTWEYDDSETSANFFRQKLDEISDNDEIELFINSYGGSVKEGVAIYNMLKRKPCQKICYIDGFAYSVASVIALACDKIIMGLGTSMMIHDMWINVSGNAKELRKQADDLDVLMESNRQIYLNRAKNLTEEELIEMMEKETILTPEQCLEIGFCDEISSDIGGDEKQLLQIQREQFMQEKQEWLLQKSLRQEYLEFMQSAKKNKNNDSNNSDDTDQDTEDEDNNNSNDNEDKDKKDDEDKENVSQKYLGSFLNAIKKL
ncbi:MAG: head maturation protease, ClpP-related [Romboutsia sp.]|jgi:ATP-dependent protease ClpP protease subunit